MEENKSYVIIEDIHPKDWLFGISAIDNEIKVEDGNWNPYLPSNEKQRRGFESFCCTNFSSTSAVEMLITRLIRLKMVSVSNLKWLNDKGYLDDNGNINFSDRFDALISGTNPQWGNSLKAPAEAKRKYGLIPEKMLPWVEDRNEYFDKSKITPEMRALGLEFKKRFSINYEIVYEKDYQIALRISPLAGACFAWDGTTNGVFHRVSNRINHAVIIFKPPPTNWHIFDSYNPFIKRLADNYLFLHYAIRHIVRENTGIPEASVKDNMYKLLRDPQKPDEVYAFNEQMTAKRHISNKATLVEGAKNVDQYWAWNENLPIVVATQEEFDNAMEVAEILLLAPDSEAQTPTGSKFNIFKWILSLFKK